MALTAAKCPSCGANMQIDGTKEAGICQHCGTAFITEQAINHYNVTNNVTNNMTIANASIVMNAEKEVEYRTLRVGRIYNANALYGATFDILVDDQVFATLAHGTIEEIRIDKNKEHRIQCVVNCDDGIVLKSNVLFIEKGSEDGILIQTVAGGLGNRHQIQIYTKSRINTVDLQLPVQNQVSQQNAVPQSTTSPVKALGIGSIVAACMLLFLWIGFLSDGYSHGILLYPGIFFLTLGIGLLKKGKK